MSVVLDFVYHRWFFGSYILVQLVQHQYLLSLLTGWLILAISLTARLCFRWEFNKLPKAEFMAFKKNQKEPKRTKKNISSLWGHALTLTSISTSYQVKFTVGKYIPSANPPYNQDHLLSGRFISGIECISNWRTATWSSKMQWGEKESQFLHSECLDSLALLQTHT